MAEFKKLSAVEAVETVSETANVLIEENGVIKRAAKSEIGAQADWAEMDENSPAFIKNKPESGSSTTGTDIEFFLQNGQVEILKGSYEDIYNKLLNKEPVYAVLTDYRTGGSPSMWDQYYAQTIFIPDYEGGLITFQFVAMDSSGILSMEIRYNSDGSAEYNSKYFNLNFQ